MIPDQRQSLRRDQRPGQVGFSPSRTTSSPTVYFQVSRIITMLSLCLDTFQVIQLILTLF